MSFRDVSWIKVGVILLLHIILTEALIEKYDMSRLCRQTLSFDREGIVGAQIDYTVPYDSAPGPLSCTMMVTGIQDPTRLPRLSITVYDLHLGKTCTSYLEIGRYRHIQGFLFKEMSWKVCNEDQIGFVMPTSHMNEYFLLNFTGDSSFPPYLKTSFQVKISAFYEDTTCNQDERRCMQDGRCVSSDLWCRNFNPCGDNSDKCSDGRANKSSDIHYGTVIGMALSVVLVGLIFVSITLYIRKRQILRQRRASPSETTQNIFARLREAYSRGTEEGNENPAMADPPPAYNELDHDSPPAYESVMSNMEIYKISGSIASLETIHKAEEPEAVCSV